jgi:hypothetical protein
MRSGGSGICSGTVWEALALNVASMACLNVAASNCAREATRRISAKSRERLVSTRIPSRVGMQFLGNLGVQWVTAHFRRGDFGKRQEIRRSQFDWSLKDAITISNVQMEGFKRAAIKQAANWETEPAPWRTGRRLCWLAHLELKPITEIKHYCCGEDE